MNAVHFGIKEKLGVGTVSLNVILSIFFGYLLYEISDGIYFNEFKQRSLKLNEIVSLATESKNFTSWKDETTLKDSSYRDYNRFLQGILERQDEIEYLFVLNYDKEKDQLKYIASGSKSVNDTIWIESWNFGINLQRVDSKNFKIFHKDKFYNQELFLNIKEKKVHFHFKEEEDRIAFKLNDSTLFYYSKEDVNKFFDSNGKELNLSKGIPIQILVEGDYSDEVQVYYTPKGTSDVVIGAQFFNNVEIANRLKDIWKKTGSEISPQFENLNYGKYYIASTVMKDDNSFPYGISLMKISEKNVEGFRSKLKKRVLFTVLISFIMNFFFISFFAKLILDPIQKINKLVNTIFLGDLSARVSVQSKDELEELGDSLNVMVEGLTQAKKTIQNQIDNLERRVEERTSELSYLLNVIRKDMFIARNIQETLLQKDYTNYSNEITVKLYNLPKYEVGGDFYDIFRLSEGKYRIFLADATGHGVKAALITMLIKTEYENHKDFQLLPGEILRILNSHFIYRFANLASYFCCAIIDIDLTLEKIYFSAAGHPDQVILKDTGGIIVLKNTGPLLGITDNINYPTIEAPFIRKDKLFLFTDGLYDVFDINNEVFGHTQLQTTLLSYNGRSLNDIMENTIGDISIYSKDSSFTDDMTFIGIEFIGYKS
ncbi:MAG: SpoIIE family protein phosphatase [Leptospiraceae bacterium]|nr:SpoIIE family protein phosphatase [Leptospiraceae bacterium]